MSDLPATGVPAVRTPTASLINVEASPEFWLFRQPRPAWIWGNCAGCSEVKLIHWYTHHFGRRSGSDLCGGCAADLYDQRS